MRQNTADTHLLTVRRYCKAHTASLPSAVNAAICRFLYHCGYSKRRFCPAILDPVSPKIHFTLRNTCNLIISRGSISTRAYFHRLLYARFIISYTVSRYFYRFTADISHAGNDLRLVCVRRIFIPVTPVILKTGIHQMILDWLHSRTHPA